MRSWRLDLDSDAHSPRLARRSLRSWLELVECDDETKVDVTILVSECVTLAVTNNATRISIRVVFDDGRLRIDVHAQHVEDRARVVGDRPETPSEAVMDRVAAAAAQTWARRADTHETHTWAEILC